MSILCIYYGPRSISLLRVSLQIPTNKQGKDAQIGRKKNNATAAIFTRHYSRSIFWILLPYLGSCTLWLLTLICFYVHWTIFGHLTPARIALVGNLDSTVFGTAVMLKISTKWIFFSSGKGQFKSDLIVSKILRDSVHLTNRDFCSFPSLATPPPPAATSASSKHPWTIMDHRKKDTRKIWACEHLGQNFLRYPLKWRDFNLCYFIKWPFLFHYFP